MRGRLIFPFVIELAQLDTVGTAADPDAAGPRLSGYDAVFRETVILPTADLLGESARVETLLKVRGQFGNTNAFLQMQQAASGNLGTTEFTLLFHFQDLENAGLVETATGLATIKVGDRLNAIYDKVTGDLVQAVRNPPGAFCTKAEPMFGLGSKRNLLVCTFRGRDPGGSV